MGIEYFHHRMVLLLIPRELSLKELFKNSLYSKGTEEFSFSTQRLASRLAGLNRDIIDSLSLL